MNKNNITTIMKNILIIIALFTSLCVSAQNVNSKLTKGGTFKGLNKQGDTLVASGTVDYVLELGSDVFGLMDIAIESDSVSGTAAYSSYLYGSMNGVDWGTPIDTVIHSGGGDNYGKFDLLNATQVYYLISTEATSATQKSKLKIFGRLNEGFVIQQ